MKVWNDAAFHLTPLYNVLHKASGVVAFTCTTGCHPDVQNLHLFGCPLKALKPGNQDLDDKSRFGRFAGYDTSMKLFYYYPLNSSKELLTPNA